MNDQNYSLQDMDALYGTRPALSADQSVTCPSGYEAYILKTGDTLNSVAASRGITLTELLFYNAGLNPFAYKAGDTICVPELPGNGNTNNGNGNPGNNGNPNNGNNGNNGNTGNGQGGNAANCRWVCDESGDSGGTVNCGEGTVPYTVVSGDTLRAIAQKFGITLEELVAANPGVVANRLQIGQILCIPQKPDTPANPCGENGTVVTLESTDVVALLRSYNVSYAALSASNPNVDLTRLTVGQKLCVPASGSRGSCANGKGAYVVGQNVTLSQLAQSLGVTELALLMANPQYTPEDFGKNAVICLP